MDQFLLFGRPTIRFATAIVAAAFVLSASVQAKPPFVGHPAPAFTVALLDKTKVSSTDLTGKVVLLNLWATWCVPCKAEMPMMHIYNKRNQSKGLVIYGIVTDDNVPARQLAKVDAVLSYQLAKSVKGNYPILSGVPTSYIIDRKGILRYAKAGAFSDSEFAALIDPLLAEAE